MNFFVLSRCVLIIVHVRLQLWYRLYNSQWERTL